uniref:Claudin n=1 Tax=Attheya septentrionalis TaxID=420275 RepID=A0A7S2UC58_9STRA|mmetsp:Transcript_17696/g.31985  ORF Transcript_17696/g.31985 Transcript_17696/m.31985 type:complete len:202 (+) Transcript_17696:129-734(+)|eukprot:CAMPEP_0198292996 /NCGR_PEP_ID=MMETSP1449-20131203/14920_1 /TAXON_ID=420275 /ORGANISM="Attheya septentrionalis, Strain CCMP2084" /LENGTH=201 /DNA_ID=CAMNT_0043992389 /DNA_START=100 /DNA_END=705 /DNA_ORIENTATION=-
MCAKCCSYPNGTALGITVGILATVSFLLSVFATYGCHYVDVDLRIQTPPISGWPDDDDIPWGENTVGFGLYTRESNYWTIDENVDSNYACRDWSERDRDFFFDGPWKAARAMAVISTIFGFAVMVCTFIMPCMRFPRFVLKIMALLLLLAGIFCFLSLVALASDICKDYDCVFSHSAGVAIAAGIMYFITGCVLYMMKEGK